MSWSDLHTKINDFMTLFGHSLTEEQEAILLGVLAMWFEGKK